MEPRSRIGDLYPLHHRAQPRPRCSRCGTEVRARRPDFLVRCVCADWMEPAGVIYPGETGYEDLSPIRSMARLIRRLPAIAKAAMERLRSWTPRREKQPPAAPAHPRSRPPTPIRGLPPHARESGPRYYFRTRWRRIVTKTRAPHGFCGKCSRPHAIWDIWYEPLPDGREGPSRCGHCRSTKATQPKLVPHAGFWAWAISTIVSISHGGSPPSQYRLG
jgi:hypothetical protein